MEIEAKGQRQARMRKNKRQPASTIYGTDVSKNLGAKFELRTEPLAIVPLAMVP